MAPASANAEAFRNSRSITNTPIAIQHKSGQDRAFAEHLKPLIQDTNGGHLLEPDRGGRGACRAERAVHQHLCPCGKMRRQRKDDGRGVA
jgi:hypothetical protein